MISTLFNYRFNYSSPGKNTGVDCHALLHISVLFMATNICGPYSICTRPQYMCCCCYRYVASVMSDSVRPHSRQPTRLPRPWDSPGKNSGAGCHFFPQCVKVKSESEVAQLCPTLSDPMDCSLPGSSIHGIFQARVLEWGAVASSGICANC